MLPDLVMGQGLSTILSSKGDLDNNEVFGRWRDTISAVGISNLNVTSQSNTKTCLETGVTLRY